jgi:hypothetical protein
VVVPSGSAAVLVLCWCDEVVGAGHAAFGTAVTAVQCAWSNCQPLSTEKGTPSAAVLGVQAEAHGAGGVPLRRHN